MKNTVVIQQQDKPEVPAEVIAQSIKEIADSMRQISKSRLKREALVILIHDWSKVSKPNIRMVLNNLDELERIWLK